MKNSYQNDIQTVQLGNIISSVGSLLDRSESMQETLSMFHLEQSAEILLQLLEAGEEPVKTEILTASFLGDVAEVLYKRLAGLDFPEDTPKNVLAALANGLMVKIGLVGDELDELETYASRMDGYLYEGRDERLKRIAELHILSDWLMQAYERIGKLLPERLETEEQRLIKRFSFWQASGYTADYLYLEGLSDDLMASDFLHSTLQDDLSNLQAAPESCRALIARTVRLCNVVDQDGSLEKEERLQRIDNVILDYNFHIPMSEWDFVSLPDGYLTAYMKLRAGEIRLNEVEQSLTDERMCRCAVYVHPDDIAYVPQSFCRLDMADYALSYGSPENLRYISQDMQTPQQVALALSRDPMTANYANPDLVSYEIASAIVLKDGRAIQFLRPENYTNQQFTALAQLALIQSPDVLKYIRPKFQTKEVIAVAVRKDYRCFKQIPVQQRTAEMMIYFLFVDPRIGEFVPVMLLKDEVFRKKASLITNSWERYAALPEISATN